MMPSAPPPGQICSGGRKGGRRRTLQPKTRFLPNGEEEDGYCKDNLVKEGAKMRTERCACDVCQKCK